MSAVYSSSVTDAEWAILEPLLPAPGSTAGRGGRPEKHCRRGPCQLVWGAMGIARWEVRVRSRCEVQAASDDLVMSFQVAKRSAISVR